MVSPHKHSNKFVSVADLFNIGLCNSNLSEGQSEAHPSGSSAADMTNPREDGRRQDRTKPLIENNYECSYHEELVSKEHNRAMKTDLHLPNIIESENLVKYQADHIKQAVWSTNPPLSPTADTSVVKLDDIHVYDETTACPDGLAYI